MERNEKEIDAFDEEALDMAIKALEQNYDDAISKQTAIDFINAGHLINPNEPRWSDNEVVNFLKSRPSVNPYEPKTGYWIDADGDNARCSCCNRLNHLYGTYCKYCGAKMVEPQERSE